VQVQQHHSEIATGAGNAALKKIYSVQNAFLLLLPPAAVGSFSFAAIQ
jgi:hypothetical protein